MSLGSLRPAWPLAQLSVLESLDPVCAPLKLMACVPVKLKSSSEIVDLGSKIWPVVKQKSYSEALDKNMEPVVGGEGGRVVCEVWGCWAGFKEFCGL